uniref:Methyltransferase FkbM domain-containing protein n=1 Tax=Tetradesmus obliquus TaxID=3088 RepID=A0A383WPH4_TETOB|eukprot:jgi/Sobl393_1/8950/SZX79360.1
MIALLVLLQAVSCGMFFCVRLPFSNRPYVDYRDLISELDMEGPASSSSSSSSSIVAAASSSLSRQQQQLTAPKLIPRVIHQTYRSTRLPASAKQFMHSWQERNGEAWQVRLYSDEACLNFVRREFPEYFEAYMNLPKEVERADFFRYMVVLRLGGVYADIDVECRQPLDGVIQPADTLLVGWDAELADIAAAATQQYARQRQMATWFFAAAPGHPVLRELCDHIAHNVMTVFSNNTVRDTLERTGQGVWTDRVLRHALQHPAAKHDDPWKVRILPRVAFGVHPSGDDELGPHLPGVVVLHHFLGSWQWQGSWARGMPAHRKALQIMSPLLPKGWVRTSSGVHGEAEPVRASNVSHFPVSVNFVPPFTMMVNLVGSGDKQAGVDVSAAVTAHGAWQPAVAPYRKPAVVEALVGALSRHSSSHANSPVGAGSSSSSSGSGPAATDHAVAPAPAVTTAASVAAPSSSHSSSRSAAAAHQQPHRGVLVDIGAGHGFFSLAAAARGHRVIAFETAPGSLAAFKASIAYNGFGSLIELRNTVLGATPGKVCLQQQDELAGAAAAAAAADGSAATQQQQQQAGPASSAAGDSSELSTGTAGVFADASVPAADGSSSSSNGLGRPQQRLLLPEVVLRRRRGYPQLSEASETSSSSSAGCARPAQRMRLSDALANSTGVAVLRVSAHGHEGFIIEGALDLLKSPGKPDVVYIEFCPAAMRAAGYTQPQQLLQQLYELGYTDVAHAGRVCDKRWGNVTRGMRLQVTLSPSAHAMQQPTWCKLRPEQFQLLLDHADAAVPENVLFVLGHPNHQQGEAAEGPRASNSSGSGQESSGSNAGNGSKHSSREQVGSSHGVPAAAAAAPVTDKAAVQGVALGSSSRAGQQGSSVAAATGAAGSRQAAGSAARQVAAGKAAAAYQSVRSKHNLGRRVGMRGAGRDGR